MSSQQASQLQLSSEHCRAICDEIGDRLRFALRKDTGEMPQRLRVLIDRLAELDADQAPSIVPAMDDMARWPTAA